MNALPPDRHSPEEVNVDEHLRTALRHAPDRALEPPAALSRAILRAAHEHTARQTHADGGRVSRLLAWLLSGPALGSGFAALAVATLVTLMWQGEEPPAPVRKTPPPEVRIAPAEPYAATQAELQAPTAVAQPSPAKPFASPSPAPRRAAAPRAEVPAEQKTEPERTGQERSKLAGSVREAMADAAAPQREAAAPAAAPAAMPAAESAALPDARVGTQRAMSGAPVPTSPVAALLAQMELASRPAASGELPWTWSTPDSAAAGQVDASARAWLQRLQQLTQRRWQPAGANAPAAGEPGWRWWRGAQLRASVLIEPTGLRWIDANGSQWHASLSPEEIQALRRP